MSEEFQRSRRLPSYVFAEVNVAKAQARSRGEDIIDLDMGNPDSPMPAHIVAKLFETVADPRSHGYSVSKESPGLRRALAGYYARRFNVEFDPENEVIATIGSKEGLVNLAFAITSPGDTILISNPSYSIYQFGFVIVGASMRSIPAEPGEEMLRARPRGAPLGVETHRADCELLVQPQRLRRRPRLLPRDRGLRLPRRHLDPVRPRPCRDLLRRPGARSVLQVDGRREIVVEFTSISKIYPMAGWQIDFAACGIRLISGLASMKSYFDYSAFRPIQVAAVAALNSSRDCVDDMRTVYRERRDVLIRGLAAAGRKVLSPESSMFAGAPIPLRYAHLRSVAFSRLLLARAQVALASGFGEYGEGFVPVELVENTQQLRQATRNIRPYLQADGAVAPPSLERVD